jgi:hypothetical protein
MEGFSMLKFDPRISIKSLLGVEPSSIVQLGTRLGFCAVSGTDKEKKQPGVVAYDDQKHNFELLFGTWPPVITFNDPPAIRPDLGSFQPGIGPHDKSTCELYIYEEHSLIALMIGNTLHLLDLNTGIYRDATQSTLLMSSFRRWSLCLTAPNGQLVPLFKASAL